MLLYESYDNDISNEFLFEKPIGWSSACFESTIDYYLDCNYIELIENEENKNNTIDC